MNRILGAVLVAALTGCQGTGLDLSGGLDEILDKGVHWSWSVPTVHEPQINYPRHLKVAPP